LVSLCAIPFGVTFVLLLSVPPFGSSGRFVYLVVSLALDLASPSSMCLHRATPEPLARLRRAHQPQFVPLCVFDWSGLGAAVMHPMIVDAFKPVGGEQLGYFISA